MRPDKKIQYEHKGLKDNKLSISPCLDLSGLQTPVSLSLACISPNENVYWQKLEYM